MRGIDLPNGYFIQVKKEQVSNVGRSLFRGLEQEQVVLEMIDQRGKSVYRFPIPFSVFTNFLELVDRVSDVPAIVKKTETRTYWQTQIEIEKAERLALKRSVP
jgi:hypothetical protein